MIKQIYHVTSLTGGVDSTYLDYADGNSLSDKDRAFAIVSGVVYLYELNATSGAAESSPNVISPDTNAGTKRWILIGQNLAGLTFTAAAVGFTIAGGTTSKTLTVSLDSAIDQNLTTSASPSFARVNALAVKSIVYSYGDTTPSVLNASYLGISNTDPTIITNFDDGVEGQVFYLYFSDGQTTITRDNARLAGGTNFISSPHSTLTLIKVGAEWKEVCRSTTNL